VNALLQGPTGGSVLTGHALAVELLPPLHQDPFDRMLVAQSNVEGITLLTGDAKVSQYPGSIRYV
jgi:PIN domain nuclease of toxin-antitoxin system